MSSLGHLINLALKEDIGTGDITTHALINPKLKVKAIITAKQTGVIAGLPLIALIYKILDKKIKVDLKIKEGAKVKKGKIIAQVSGLSRPILTGERTVLNFLQRMSGVATLTREFISKTKRYGVEILDTRKTIPAWRSLDKYAVSVGGGTNHRLGLYDAVLIKDNHLACLTQKGINKIKKALKKTKGVRVPIEIEVKNIDEFKTALEEEPHIILLDNMKITSIKKAVSLRNKSGTKTLLEISGGINLKNIIKFARTGVDFISIGTLTHSARTLDISMNFIPSFKQGDIL